MSASTLFIPDISGFTRFVKTTEINHSRHIIEELINLIIKSAGSSFEVAEIEGDAVFFYSEKPYNAKEILKISKQIFIDFHTHLLQYQHNRICNCGACSTAIDLNLKFIGHNGVISFAKYGKREQKPFGDSVITIHRLLKNDVPSSEYVLLSENIPNHDRKTLDGDGLKVDDDLGELRYSYLLIEDWKNEAVLEAKDRSLEHIDLEVSSTRQLNAEAQYVHHFISDFRYRKIWNKQANEVVYDHDHINKVGTSHYCIINNKKLDFDTIRTEFDKGLAYGEALRNPSPFKHAEIKFYIQNVGVEVSEIRFVMSVSYKWLIQRLLVPIFTKGLKMRIKESLNHIASGVMDNLELLKEDISLPDEST